MNGDPPAFRLLLQKVLRLHLHQQHIFEPILREIEIQAFIRLRILPIWPTAEKPKLEEIYADLDYIPGMVTKL